MFHTTQISILTSGMVERYPVEKYIHSLLDTNCCTTKVLVEKLDRFLPLILHLCHKVHASKCLKLMECQTQQGKQYLVIKLSIAILRNLHFFALNNQWIVLYLIKKEVFTTSTLKEPLQT